MSSVLRRFLLCLLLAWPLLAVSRSAVADELAATEIYEDEGTDPEDLQSLLISFGELAQLAESQGQVLYVRITIVLEQDE